MILSWILTGISTSIVPQVASYKTSAGVWLYLQRLYAFGTQIRQLHLRLQLQSIRKGGTSIEEYITKIVILRDALAATREKLKESEVILSTLQGMSDKYEAFVTSVTTRWDPNLTFSKLGELLMDQELRIASRNSAAQIELEELNIVIAKTDRDKPDAKTNAGSRYDLRCQICSRKGHEGNRLLQSHKSITLFLPNHSRTLSPSDPNGGRSGSVNTIRFSSSDAMIMWYPDSGAASHVTNSGEKIQHPHPLYQ